MIDEHFLGYFVHCVFLTFLIPKHTHADGALTYMITFKESCSYREKCGVKLIIDMMSSLGNADD